MPAMKNYTETPTEMGKKLEAEKRLQERREARRAAMKATPKG